MELQPLSPQEVRERLVQIRREMSYIMQKDLRTGIQWLTSIRVAAGTLDVAIDVLLKEMEKAQKPQKLIKESTVSNDSV